MKNVIKKCKCCDNMVNVPPILQYENMPKMAQNFPDDGGLESDTGINLEIYECPYCGMIQLFCEPVSYYRDVIRAVAVSEDMKEFRREYFHRFIEETHMQGKRLLEVGAGCGEYMELMAKEDVEVFGLEHLESSVVTAKERGLSVFEGFIENAEYKVPCAPYDGFYIMNFLEHIPEPKEFLKGIAANLSDGAWGLVEVPNGDFIIGQQLFSEFMLDHVSYFTKESLTQILSVSGFQVEKCEVIWNDYIISAVVRKRSGLDTFSLRESQDVLVGSVSEYLDKMKKTGKKVAVWGAGHQALALMALARMQEKVECVIDSADFKQGRYTPVTHIPVCSPKKIAELGIDAILVIAGSYTDEVCRLIEESYGWVTVSTLRSIQQNG